MATTWDLSDKTSITILAKLYSPDGMTQKLQLFLVDIPVALDNGDEVEDTLSFSIDGDVVVQVISTDGEVVVTSIGGPSWSTNSATVIGGLTLYRASAEFPVPTTSDGFNITVLEVVADPTVVIKRTGFGAASRGRVALRAQRG
jgi:hypothetical protein